MAKPYMWNGKPHDMLEEIELMFDAFEGLLEDLTENNLAAPYANDTLRVSLAERLIANQGGE